MKHFSLTTTTLVIIWMNSFGLSNSTNQSFKHLVTDESTHNWMNLKKEKTVDDFLKEAKTIFGLDEFSDFRTLKVETDDLDWKHHKIQQYFNGIPIEAAQYILHEKDGFIKKANGKLVVDFKKKRDKPSISKKVSIERLLNQINSKKYIWDDDYYENSLKMKQNDLYATYYPNPELVYMSPKFDQNWKSYQLAYKMEVSSLDPFESYVYYVDAHSGEIIHKISTIMLCEAGVGHARHSGQVDISTDYTDGEYRLHNYCLNGAGSGIITQFQDNSSNFCCPYDIVNINNNWTNHQNEIEVYYATELFYNYFQQYHNRNSTDDNGELLIANLNVKYPVNCSGDFCWNAFYWLDQAWFSNSTPSYPALTTVDVVAHEFTHGLINRTANLLYENESGALNESFADIFGVAVERLMSNNPNGLDWLIAEDALELRNMSNPKLSDWSPQPDTYLGTNWYNLNGCQPSFWNDKCGVHTNSGVQNYWFYLISEGGTGVNDNGDNYNVSGIGIVDAAKIAYRNLTAYLTPNSTFIDAQNGSVQAAIDLFGANSNQLLQVKRAWFAAGVCLNSNKTISLTSPTTGNEAYFGNALEQITWNSTNSSPSDSVVLEYSLNNGGSWKYISKAVNSGSYNWLVPSVQTAMALIRITLDGDYCVSDKSDNLFKILSCTLLTEFDISTNNPQRCVGNTILFSNETNDYNNPALNGVSYEWRIDGTLESTNFNFQKVFTSSNSYNISLQATDGSGCSSTYSYPIYIRPSSNADFTATQHSNLYTVDFFADQPDAISYNWTYNGNTIGSSNVILEHDFGAPGTYQVCLSISSSCGSATECKNITVEADNSCNVNANFTVNDNQVCANNDNNSTEFNNSSTGASIYKWFVNGIFQSSTSFFDYVFPAAGQYTVLLEASNSTGSCIDVKSINITVDASAKELEDVPNFMTCNSNITSTTLDAGINGMATYKWDLITSNTSPIFGKTIPVFESGIYKLTVIDLCGQSSSRKVTVVLGDDQDCVRPGDMNYDGKVDMDDIIHFGMHFGDCGYARDDQGIGWADYPGLDWGSSIFNDESTDVKHVDSNGNGCVDLADWDALRVNWLKEHDGSTGSVIDPVVAASGFYLNLVPDTQATVLSSTGILNLVLNLNVESDLETDLQLYAGYAIYNLNNIEQSIGQITGFPTFTIEDNVSWLTNGSIDHVSHQFLDPATNEFKVGFTRLDQQNRSGSGTIGQMAIQIVDLVPPDVNGQSIDFQIDPVQSGFFNSDGEILPLGQSSSIISSALWYNDCTNEDVLINQSGSSNNYKSVSTRGTITTIGDIDIHNHSNVTYSANRIKLNTGFKARSESGLRIRTSPLCTPPDNGNKESEAEVENTQSEATNRDKSTSNTEHPALDTQTQPQKD